MDISDREIIEGCIRKEGKYQRMLYDKYADVLFGVCRKNSRSKEDAEDIFQDAFIKLYSSLEKYSYLGSFEGWMKKFFMRCAWNYYRDKKDKYPKTEIMENIVPGVENTVLDEFSNQQLIACLQQLADKERSILVMSEIEGMSWNEIAQTVNLEIPTVRSVCSRAKKKLLNIFAEFDKTGK
ncbi:MAG: sigma-70 family RNA polymerase sigma factor [Bacteroidales bacterium]|nr:sigma-70 family RNA polymerase sigma factor [Bacteroidales bacterium]